MDRNNGRPFRVNSNAQCSRVIKCMDNANASDMVGGLYTPTNQVANNEDNDRVVHPVSLDYYLDEFLKNGFETLSEYKSNYTACGYCE